MRHRYRDPLPSRLRDAILSLQPTAYWPLDDGSGPLRSLGQSWPATVTGSPTFGVAAPEPIGRGITWIGSGQYATTSGSVPVPSSSLSVLAIAATTDTTAASRSIVSRGAASQYSWDLRISSTHAFQFIASQSSSAGHAAATVGASVNDGNLCLVVGTFDGTTIRAYRGVLATGQFASASSTSLTGTWHKASTAGVQIAARADVQQFPGSIFTAAVLTDRVLTESELRWLFSIAAGG